MIQRIDKLVTPPIVGQGYLVPVFIHNDYDIGERFIAPLINHLHNDKENDQHEPHYHVDTRFIDYKRQLPIKRLHKLRDNWFYYKRIYPHEFENFKIEDYYLQCYNSSISFITSPHLIHKSSLRHNCIYKGKCPHRGYDLSSQPIVNGVVTCPLHGLQFDANTGEVLNATNQMLSKLKTSRYGKM